MQESNHKDDVREKDSTLRRSVLQNALDFRTNFGYTSEICECNYNLINNLKKLLNKHGIRRKNECEHRTSARTGERWGILSSSPRHSACRKRGISDHEGTQKNLLGMWDEDRATSNLPGSGTSWYQSHYDRRPRHGLSKMRRAIYPWRSWE